MMMRFVLASILTVMMAGGVCGQTAGQLLIQKKKASGSGFENLFVTPEEGKALGWSGGTLGMLDVLAADGDGSGLTGITAGQVGAVANGDAPSFSQITLTDGVINSQTSGLVYKFYDTVDSSSVPFVAVSLYDDQDPSVLIGSSLFGFRGDGAGSGEQIFQGSTNSFKFEGVNGIGLANVTANSFIGGGESLTFLNANNISSGTLGVARGGTGLTSVGTAGHVLTSTGTGFVMSAPSGGGGGTVTSVAGTGSVNGLTLTGTVTSTGSLTLGGALSGTASMNINGTVGATTPTTGAFTTIGVIGAANANLMQGTGYSLTGTNASSMIDLAGTWNTTGTPSAIKLDITDTASNSSSLLMQLLVGGANRFRIFKNGDLFSAGNLNGSILSFSNYTGGGDSGQIVLGGSLDTRLQRDGAAVWAMRNGATPHALNIERTFTSATNRETLAMGWRASPSLFLIQPVAGSGGGTAQDVGLARGGSITTGAVITDGTAQVYTTSRGGIAGREAIRTVATNTTATTTDRTMLVDASAGSVTITLPAVSGLAGFRLNVKVLTTNAGANTVTVDPNGSETVDGSAASLTSTTAYTSWQLHCDGAAWFLIK